MANGKSSFTACRLAGRILAMLLAGLWLAPGAQGQLVAPFTSTDVGSGSGTTDIRGDSLWLTSTGADIWEAEDAFRFAHVAFANDAAIVVKLDDYAGPSEWGKAGLLFRDGLGASARFVDLVRTRDHGLEFQYRAGEGANAQTIATVRSVVGLPVWLQLTREQDRFTAFYRTATAAPWIEVDRFTLALPDTVFAGFAVTSGNGQAPGQATFFQPVVEGLACVETAPEFALPDRSGFPGQSLELDLAAYVFSNACSGEVTYALVSGAGAVEGSRYRWTATTPGTYPVTVRATNLGGSTQASFTVRVLSATLQLPPLHVDGRHIKDPDGNIVILRGVAVADLRVLNTQRSGWPATRVMERAADEFGARVIRLTVHPSQWLPDPDGYFIDHLDPAVQWAVEHGVYVIVDWHYVAGGGNDPSYPELADETRAFWSATAPRYAGNANVLYELFNEPAEPADWATWKSFAQPWIDLIRSRADNLLLVSGYWFSSIIAPALDDPFEGDDLVYVAHVYPDQAGATNPDPKAVWEANWGTVADRFPVIVTEWGYENVPGHHWSGGTGSNYGEPLQAYIEGRGLSWTAWCFDSVWGPKMFDNDWNVLSGDDFQGQFVKDWLLFHRGEERPVLGISASALDFGMHSAGEEATRTLQVWNTGQGPLDLSITSDHPQFAVDAPDFSVPVAVAVGDTLTVTVRFLSLGGGIQQGTLIVQHNAIGGERRIDLFGLSRGAATGVEDPAGVPAAFALAANYPNPFNPRTMVPFDVARPTQVRLAVFDTLGREVAVLLDAHLTAGQHSVPFHAASLPSGSYLIALLADGRRVDVRAVVLAK